MRNVLIYNVTRTYFNGKIVTEEPVYRKRKTKKDGTVCRSKTNVRKKKVKSS